MSTFLNPVGPKKKSVYIRRRLFVLIGLLVVVGAVVLVIVKPGSTGGAAEAPEVLLPDEVLAGEHQDNPSSIPNCGAGELRITPVTDENSYAAGEQPKLSMRIENIGDAQCQAQLGTGGMIFRITSGPDEVWRSTDCQVNPDQRAVILEPDTPLSTEPIVWDRTRSSAKTCDVPRDPVVAGGATYHLQVSVVGVQGEGTAPFLLY